MNRVFTLLLVLVACVAHAAAAQEPIQPPKFIPVNVGNDGTSVNAINNSGVMVGLYYTPAVHGFAIVGKNVFTIDVPPSMGNETACLGINSSGSIVGQYASNLGGIRGFLYRNNQFTDIGPPGNAYAAGINDLGIVVGFSGDSGFLWDGTQYQFLIVPGAVTTRASAINNHGVIVLNWTDAKRNTHSSLFDGTTYTNIDLPGAMSTYGLGINNAGDVAITWLDSKSVQHGAVLYSGQYQRFMVPASSRTEAVGLNDYDVVVGVSWAATVETGYKLIP